MIWLVNVTYGNNVDCWTTVDSAWSTESLAQARADEITVMITMITANPRNTDFAGFEEAFVSKIVIDAPGDFKL